MQNPTWERTLNIAQVSLDLIQMELEMEWQNGKENIQGSGGGQPAGTGEEVPNDNGGIAEEQRPPQPDAGSDY